MDVDGEASSRLQECIKSYSVKRLSALDDTPLKVAISQDTSPEAPTVGCLSSGYRLQQLDQAVDDAHCGPDLFTSAICSRQAGY